MTDAKYLKRWDIHPVHGGFVQREESEDGCFVLAEDAQEEQYRLLGLVHELRVELDIVRRLVCTIPAENIKEIATAALARSRGEREPDKCEPEGEAGL